MRLNYLILLSLLVMSLPLYVEGSSFSSVYTRLTDCETVESSVFPDEGPGWLVEKCPGKEDYQILIKTGDDRSWVAIKKGNQEIIDLYEEVVNKAAKRIHVNFPEISGKVGEWRYKGKEPIAFIFRIGGHEEIYNDKTVTYKARSILLVIRLENKKACFIGTTTSNLKARKMADGNKTCP